MRNFGTNGHVVPDYLSSVSSILKLNSRSFLPCTFQSQTSVHDCGSNFLSQDENLKCYVQL